MIGIMEKCIDIYYFSGTGNTKMLLDIFTNALTENGHHVATRKMEKESNVAINKNTTLGLAFPVAIQSTYPLVWDFVYKLPKVKDVEIFMFDTMEDFSGGVVGPMKKVLSKKGYNCIGAREFKMSSSMNLDPNKINIGVEKNKKARQDINQYALDLIHNKTKWNRVPFFSDLMRSISISNKEWVKMSKNITITDDCIQCKLCMKNCPVSSISPIENKVEINHEICNSCMRCVSLCPKNAILVKGKQILLS
jgi:Pyruvate/2-oxoacid:ferredoxin oxidoreductase delta subunit/flavodoxin